jgi:hypothetical protein
MSDPAETARVAQAQLDAYNAHDIDAFAACYTEDVEVNDLGGAARSTGIQALRETYGALFASRPGLHAHLVGRLVVGDTAVDQERVVGLRDDGVEVHALAIYKVRDGRIARIWFSRG